MVTFHFENSCVMCSFYFAGDNFRVVLWDELQGIAWIQFTTPTKRDLKQD